MFAPFLRDAMVVSWFVMVGAIAVLSFVSVIVLCSLSSSADQLRETHRALQRLEEILPGLNARNTDIREMSESLRTRAAYLEKVIVDAEQREADHDAPESA